MKSIFLCLLTFLCFSLPAYAENTARPVIGISGSSASSSSVRAMFTQVAASGGIPLLLSNFDQRDPSADIKKIDGLIIMGNSNDIDPARYGAAPHSETSNEMSSKEGRVRADYEYQIMALALKAKVPLLGICGGHQRLNVLRGGSLHQHVPDLVGHEKHAQFKQNIAPFVPVMPVEISTGTQLAAIADDVDSLYVPGREADRSLMTNSMHHQAINKLGNGLRAVAFSDSYEVDGEKQRIIEAIEPDPAGMLAGQFVLGVQWHPEFSSSPLGPRLTKRLVAAAAKKATQNPTPLSKEQIAAENRLSAAVTGNK